MKKRVPYFIFALFTIAFLNGKEAQAQNATASVEKDAILVGEQIKLKLDFTVPKQATNIAFPVFENNQISPQIECIAHDTSDTISLNDGFTFSQTYLITSFDSGMQTIPILIFSYFMPGDTAPVQVYSDSLNITVQLVEVDTAAEIKDIKALWTIPFQWRDYIPHMLIGFAILVAIVVFLYFYMRRRKGLPLFPAKMIAQLPPDEEALQMLEKIKREKIWRAGLIKDYYTHLTDTLRHYLERRFHVQALEQTSSETIESLHSIDINEEARQGLERILKTADMVKFAKGNPIPTENEHCLDLAFTFVNLTKNTEVEQSVEPESEDNSKQQAL